MDQVVMELDALAVEDADPNDVTKAIVRVIDLPHGERPVRTHVGPSSDGADVAVGVGDRVGRELLRHIGLEDRLKPRL